MLNLHAKREISERIEDAGGKGGVLSGQGLVGQ